MGGGRAGRSSVPEPETGVSPPSVGTLLRVSWRLRSQYPQCPLDAGMVRTQGHHIWRAAVIFSQFWSDPSDGQSCPVRMWPHNWLLGTKWRITLSLLRFHGEWVLNYLEWKSFIKQIIVTDVVPCMHRVEHFQHHLWTLFFFFSSRNLYNGYWVQFIKADPFPFHKVSGASSFYYRHDKVGPHFFLPNYLQYYLC